MKSYSAGGESGFSSSSRMIFIAWFDAVGVFVFVERCCNEGRSTSSSTKPKKIFFYFNSNSIKILNQSKIYFFLLHY
jgi:hypothetical protein